VAIANYERVGRALELLRLRFDEQVRAEKRKTAGSALESAAAAGLRPWREVVTPHADVAGGVYQQAESAADLWQVHLGEGSDEYRDPVEQLQTNFGGGKTHTMLAL